MASEQNGILQKALLASAFGDVEFADAVVACQEKSWKVHKIIVCKASKYFHKAFTPGFKLKDSKESVDGKIDILEEDPLLVHAALQCIYMGEYDIPVFFAGSTPYFDIESWDNIAMLHATMCRIADKFEVLGLQEYALQELDRAALSDRNLSHKQLGNWCDLAHIAYNELPGSDDALKNLLVRKLRPHLEHFLKDKDFIQRLGQLGDFAVALMREPCDVMVSGVKSVHCGGYHTPSKAMKCSIFKGKTFLEVGTFNCPGCNHPVHLA